MGPLLEGFKLLRLHLLRPCWGIVRTPCQSPNPTKLPKLSPVMVAKASHHSQLELGMGVVHSEPFNLNLHLGRVRQGTQKAGCVGGIASSPCTPPQHCPHQLPWHPEGRTLEQRRCSQMPLGPCLTKLRWVPALRTTPWCSWLPLPGEPGFDDGPPPPSFVHGQCWHPDRQDNCV